MFGKGSPSSRQAQKRACISVAQSARWMVEQLERRVLLTSVIHQPGWNSEGPDAVLGDTTGAQIPLGTPDVSNPATGAVEAVATLPNTANVVFIGAASGGIWKTTDATDASPHWDALDQNRGSLSMGSIAISPFLNDGTTKLTSATPVPANIDDLVSKLVVYAGFGGFSNGGINGARQGMLMSTDGGTSWKPIGTKTFAGLDVRKIVPSLSDPKTFLVAATSPKGNALRKAGVYLTTDGGKNFKLVLRGEATGLVADPADATRFYAALAKNNTHADVGVFISENSGTSFTKVDPGNNLDAAVNNGIDDDRDGSATNPQPKEGIANAGRIELAISPKAVTGGNDTLYAGLVATIPQPGGGARYRASSVYYSTDKGATWKALPNFSATESLPDLNHLKQGWTNFVMLADPNSPTAVYLAGDALKDEVQGNMYRADWKTGATTPWDKATSEGAKLIGNNTAPHSDARNAVFDANGGILEVTDGGIYRLNDPSDIVGLRFWSSANGDLAVSEFYSVAYDNTKNSLFGGIQDIGVIHQPATNGGLTWNTQPSGDGALAQIDGNYHYTSGDSLGDFAESFFDNTGKLQVNDLKLQIVGSNAAGATLRTLTGKGIQNNGKSFDKYIQFTNPFAVNAVSAATRNKTRILIGTASLYESFDDGNTLIPIGGLTSHSGDGIDDDKDGNLDTAAAPDLDEVEPGYLFGTVDAMVYGGFEGATAKPDIAYLGTYQNNFWVRKTMTVDAHGNPNPQAADFQQQVNYKGARIRDIVVNPTNWKEGYVVDVRGTVWAFTNCGDSANDWTRITGNLGRFTTNLRSVVVINTTNPAVTGGKLVLVGGAGGVYTTLDPTAQKPKWFKVGNGMPSTIVTDLRYDSSSDLLYCATFGRGAWSVSGFVSSFLPAAARPLVLSGSGAVTSAVTGGEPGLLEITGDDTGATNDTIRLVLDPDNNDLLDVYINNTTDTPDFQVDVASVQKVSVTGGEGDDTLLLDDANGQITFPDGIDFDQTGPGTNVEQEINQTPITGIAATLRNGLQSLADWSSKLADAAELAQKLPGLGVSIASTLGIGDGSDPISGAIQKGLVDPILAYLNSTTTPTLQQLTEVLKGLSAPLGNVFFTIDPLSIAAGLFNNSKGYQDLKIDLQLHLDGFSAKLPVDFSSQLSSLGLSFTSSGTVDLSTALDMDFSFGVDLSPGLSDDQAFFIQVNDISASAHVSAGVPNAEPSDEGKDQVNAGEDDSGESDPDPANPGLNLALHLGFLTAAIEDGSLKLDAAVHLNVKNPDNDPDGHITIAELTGSTDIFDIDATGDLDVELPVKVSLAGFTPDADPVIHITSDDLFGSVPDVTTEGFDKLTNFNNFSATDVLSLIKQVVNALDSFRNTSVFQTSIPFTSAKLGDVLDVATAFTNKVITPLTNADGSSKFQTAQELGDLLAQALGLDPSLLDVHYDVATQQLTYHIAVSEAFAPKPVNVNLNADLSPVADFSASSTINLDATLSADLVLGIDLTPLQPGQTLADHFFIANASLRGTAAISASDVEALARIGFLGIGLGTGAQKGSAELLASADVNLKNPTAARPITSAAPDTPIDDSQKISVSDLVKAVSTNPSALFGPPKSVTNTVGQNINISKQIGNQSENAVAIDPTHPARVAVLANSDSQPAGMFLSIRNDDGTWTGREIGLGPKSDPTDTAHDDLPFAGPDPSIAFDSFGNLYLSYLNELHTSVVVLISQDHGATFQVLNEIKGVKFDRPTIATGPSGTPGVQAIWVAYRNDDPHDPNVGIYVTGALIAGTDPTGATNHVGMFSVPVLVPGSLNCNFAQLAVGPNGQVVVNFANAFSGAATGPTTLHISIDPDGVQPTSGFSSSLILATTTEVGPNEPIPSQADRKITPASSIVYDNSAMHHGRLYMVYTDQDPNNTVDTDIYVRFSDSDGAQGTWSKKVKVNKDGAGHSQFWPAIAVDPKTGFVMVTWYDTRNDPTNKNVELWGAVSTDGGVTFGADFKISTGQSNEANADPSLQTGQDVDFGDYRGLVYYGGVAYPVWADNSNSTGDAPAEADGKSRFELYTAEVDVNAVFQRAASGAITSDAPSGDSPIQFTGSLDAVLPLSVQAGITLPLTGNPAVEIHWGDLTQAFDPATDLKLPDLGDALNFKDLSFADVLAAFHKLTDYVNGLSSTSFLKEKLPLINKSVSDILNYAGELGDKVAQLQQVLTVQGLHQMIVDNLGVNDSDVVVNIDPADPHAISIDLKLSDAFTNSLNLNFDLASLLDQAGGSGFVDFLKGVADISGSATLNVTAHANLDLHFGIETGGALPVPFLYDDTNGSIDAKIDGTNLAFTANLLVLSASIHDGTVSLHKMGDANQPAVFSLTLKSNGGRYDFDDLISNLTNDVNLDLDGAVDVNLPIDFPSGNHLDPLTLSIPDLSKLFTGDPNAVNITSAPNLADILNGLDLSGSLDGIIDGLDHLLALIQGALDSGPFSQNLPLVGTHLKDGADAIEQLRSQVISRLHTLFDATSDPKTISFVQEKLFEVLGPAGMNVLLDGPDTGSDITVDDIAPTVSADSNDIRFDFKLGYDPGPKQIGFDLGLPGLGLSAAGKVNVDFGFTFDMGLGINKSKGVYLRTDKQNELMMNLGVDVASFDTSASFLGLLRIKASDAGSHFGATFTVDLHDDDGELTPTEFSTSNISAALDGGADVKVHLTGGLGSSDAFPSVSSDLRVQWGFGSSPLPHTPAVTLTNVTLDAGTFFQRFVSPIVQKIQTTIAPFSTIIDFLETPLPAVSDIDAVVDAFDYNHDGKITVLDLAVLAQAIPPDFQDFIDAFQHVNDLLNKLSQAADAGGRFISLGDVPLSGIDFRNAGAASTVSIPDNTSVDAAAQLDAAGAPGAAGFIRTSLDAAPGAGLQFPLISHPSLIFKLLMGQSDVNLFTYDMPTLSIGISVDEPIPIFNAGVVEGHIKIHGGLYGTIDLGFGYDTVGLKRYKQNTSNPALLLDGFYASDKTNADGTGDPRPELTIGGDISVGIGGSVAYGLASADVSVGVDAKVTFDLAGDPPDGKIRIADLDPDCIFDVDGTLTIFLKEESSALWGAISDSSRQDLYTLPLFSHDCDVAENNPPQLAHISTGTGPDAGIPADQLVLNMGRFADLRGPAVDQNDDDEIFNISADPNVTGGVLVSAFGIVQPFSGFTDIHGEGGKGNDQILISADVMAACHLWGDTATNTDDVGNDVLQSGNGPATIIGGDGNDTITSGNDNDQIFGGDGDDLIMAGAGDDDILPGRGNDSINAGEGNDTVFDNEGNDLVFGFGGNDYLDMGSGNDTIFGGAGDDTVPEGSGNDTILGEAGNDSLFGYTGDDSILGGDGNDTISAGDDNDTVDGGAGNDSITGGNGNDELHGGDDNDTIAGEAGNDSLFGDAGNDILTGSDGTDSLDGGTGNDSLDGGNDADTIHGSDGNDSLTGAGGDDKLFGDNDNDLISGNDGNDSAEGGAGNDTIYGGTGNDTIRGQEGNDSIFGEDDADTLFGDAGNDTVVGASGNDELHGGADNDFVTGNDGNDTLYGDAGDDSLIGGTNNDTIFGNDGNDHLVGDDTVTGPSGNDSMDGGAGNDTLAGDNASIDVASLISGSGNDTMSGSAGNDLMFGQGGDDSMSGGDGNDTLLGHDGNDWMSGDAGDDDMIGNDGSDTMFGGAGVDVLLGDNGTIIETTSFVPETTSFYRTVTMTTSSGAGNDSMSGGDDADTLYGQEGNDTMSGDGGMDYMEGNQGADSMSGGDDDDDMIGGSSVAGTPDGADTMDGGSGNDVMLGDNAIITRTTSASGTAFARYLTTGLHNNAVIRSVTLLDDSIGGADSMSGGGNDDTMWGQAGNDTMSGGDGDDDMIGNDGADLMNGNAGDDCLLGDNGIIVDNLLDGSTQSTIQSSGGKIIATINLAGIKQRIVTLLNAALGGNDTILGGLGNDSIHAGAGDDSISGDDPAIVGGGDDVLFGDLGNDTMHAGDGGDHLYGGSGDDSLDGEGGADTIYGGDGQDTLTADQSGDRLMDWFGNFDSFIVPGPGFGAPVIIRSPAPADRQFVLDLASADGASNADGEAVIVTPPSPSNAGH